MLRNTDDVIIVGASFAGLAVASRIKSGKVLLISPEKAGENCKSACGTILYTVEDLGLKQAVLQVHRKIILHTSKGSLEYFLKEPFCIIDPEKFNQGLFRLGKAEKIEAQVEGFDGEVLKTNKGDFSGRIFIDASGPEAVLSQNPKRKPEKDLSFGMETILPYKEENLHFWYEPKIFPQGVFWLFPQGETCGFGVGSYVGEGKLKPHLEKFLTKFELKIGDIRGGYFPHRLRKPVLGKIFRVGDAAGHCLPITGEGIRPALFFGQKCGEIIENILLGRMTFKQGLRQYQDFVLKRRPFYEMMYWMQNFLITIPEELFYPLAWLVSQKPVTSFVLKSYLRIL